MLAYCFAKISALCWSFRGGWNYTLDTFISLLLPLWWISAHNSSKFKIVSWLTYEWDQLLSHSNTLHQSCQFFFFVNRICRNVTIWFLFTCLSSICLKVTSLELRTFQLGQITPDWWMHKFNVAANTKFKASASYKVTALKLYVLWAQQESENLVSLTTAPSHLDLCLSQLTITILTL